MGCGSHSKPQALSQADIASHHQTKLDAEAATYAAKVSAFHDAPRAPELPATKADAILEGAGISGTDYREFKAADALTRSHLLEHFQPPEFPPVPVIGPQTHELTNETWRIITGRDYDDPDAPGQHKRCKGQVFVYKTFFRLLFDRSADFRAKFPTVQAQAGVMAKVIALCLRIDYKLLDQQTAELAAVGRFHRFIVQQPWQYAQYATTLHRTISLCLTADEATPQRMAAWAHVFAFVLRGMLPEAISAQHIRVYAGVNNFPPPTVPVVPITSAAAAAAAAADPNSTKGSGVDQKYKREASHHSGSGVTSGVTSGVASGPVTTTAVTVAESSPKQPPKPAAAFNSTTSVTAPPAAATVTVAAPSEAVAAP